MKTKPKTFFPILLIALGCLQFAGYILKIPALRGLGIAYSVAPLPTVFSTINGVEGFATVQTIHGSDDNGKPDSIKLDQRVFSQFKGHYFLKQAYSIFLAYPHILKPRLVDDALNFALCERNIFKRFGIQSEIKNPSIHIERTRFKKNEHVILIPNCIN